MKNLKTGDRVRWSTIDEYDRRTVHTGTVTRISREWGLADIDVDGVQHVAFLGELTRLAPAGVEA